MPRSLGITHIVRPTDGPAFGVWGPYTLKSAYQPIFAFVDGKLTTYAFEALLRPYRDDEAIGPGAFFGMIPAIDRMHVETLARNIHLLNAGPFLGAESKLFLNFDPSLFCTRDVVNAATRDMRIVLSETGIEAGSIVCEVTEQCSTSEPALREFVESLRVEGYRIAVDDYGANSSDMNRVKSLHPDIVKFDAQWLSRLMETQPGVALLRRMVDEFSELGIVSVFEGIEESWQLEVAEEAGAAMVQGYVLARPQIAPTTFLPSAKAPLDAAADTGDEKTGKQSASTTRHHPSFGRKRE